MGSSVLGRPRRAPWVTEVQDAANLLVLTREGGNHRETSSARAESKLDEMAQLVWRNCDGTQSLGQLQELFVEAYAEDDASASRVRDDVGEVVDSLLNQDFLVLDGGPAAFYSVPGNGGEPDIVRRVVPGVELQWQLETLRRFLFGVLRVEEAGSIEGDFDQLMGSDALATAKGQDIDAARARDDSNVLSYRGSMKSPSFAACVNAIIQELEAAIPESAGHLELSGNALYLRGAHMGWHSNHSRADRRVYCSWCERPDSNFFRYEHPVTGEIVTEWEQPGWNIKTFAIPERPARFWHCIGAKSLRLAIGFRYPRVGLDSKEPATVPE